MVKQKKCSEFFCANFENKITVDQMGVEEVGIDKMGVHEIGSRRSGNKPCWNTSTSFSPDINVL